jgi:hypothetical protein
MEERTMKEHNLIKSQNGVRNVLISMTYFTLVLTSSFILYLFYLSFWPFNIVTLHEFTTVEKTIKRGEDLHYNLKFTKYVDAPSNIKYFLVDGVVLRLEADSTYRQTGSHSAYISRKIPTTINGGRYKLRIEIMYEIAPWRHITYTWESNDFLIQ